MSQFYHVTFTKTKKFDSIFFPSSSIKYDIIDCTACTEKKFYFVIVLISQHIFSGYHIKCVTRWAPEYVGKS